MLRQAGRRLWQRLFPPAVALPESAVRRLAALYPTLALRRVTFHSGLPWFARRDVGGITLPGFFSPVACRIYIQPYHWLPETDDGFSLFAHEAFHALQMQEAGPGLGFVRPFIILYLACAARNGFRYAGHPMEEDAFAVAGWRSSLYEQAVAAGTAPAPVAASGLHFWRKLVASTPGGALLSPLWLLLWTVAVIVLWVAKLGVEGVGVVTAVGMWCLGSCCAAGERLVGCVRRLVSQDLSQ